MQQSLWMYNENPAFIVGHANIRYLIAICICMLSLLEAKIKLLFEKQAIFFEKVTSEIKMKNLEKFYCYNE